MGQGHTLRLILLLVVAITASAVAASAEPCILAYPAGRVSFRFDPTQYETKGPGDPLFDPAYSVGGLMLWDKFGERVAFEIYQAPGLDGFSPSTSGRNEFLFFGAEMALVIDGFADTPRQLSDVFVQFTPRPLGVPAAIQVDGEPVQDLRYHLPRIVVSTPTGNGYFSDKTTINIKSSGVLRLEVAVYQDRNGNRILDGERCITVIMEDFTIPVEERTWGAIKAMYRGE
ncbi:MAG: hypothetical protein ACE5EO_00315 [Candidatus Krumholzibacteriia bacterium]